MQKDLKAIFGDQPPGLDEKSINSLTKALEENNLPGFDYLEYKQSLRVLGQMNMDEETAFKSAFATASTMGLTKERLLETAAHYRDVLKKEKKKFDAALSKQMKQRVESKRQEIAKLKAKIEAHQKKIKALEKEITQSQEIINKADEHIQDQLGKLENAKNSFETALESIVKQISDDIDTIEKLIQ